MLHSSLVIHENPQSVMRAADFGRVMVGLVLPLLAIASLLETFLTPVVAAWVLG